MRALSQPLKWHKSTPPVLDTAAVPMAVFKPIPGLPGYRVEDDGSVWTAWFFKGAGHARRGTWEIGRLWRRLKPDRRQCDGRARYTLRRGDGIYRRTYGSILALEVFVGPCPEGMECCHQDGDCCNDAVANLRWDTHQSNIEDKARHGTQPCGEAINTAKLTADDVREIRRIGKPLKQHAQRYGVTESLVSAILSRKAWKHV